VQRSWIAALAVALSLTATRRARADQPREPAPQPTARDASDGDDDDLVITDEDTDGRDDFEAFPLAVPHKAHVLRASLEVGGVLAIGFVDYLLNTSARGGEQRAGDDRWALRYDWPDLRGKFTGSAYELDNNRFGTNYASHPFAGTLYYTAARSNHLSIPESFLFAAFGSTMWEYFGEIREKVSVNDMLVTPMSGAAIGEATMQLWGFFRRGRRSIPNAVLAFIASPVASINAWTDGDGEPLRARETNELGFAAEPWHRFTLEGGLGATAISSITPGEPSRSYADQRLGLDLAIANLPFYDARGRVARLFSDGNQSRISVETAWSGGDLVHGVFSTRVMPAGLYIRDAGDPDAPEGARLRGSTVLVGLLMGFEYGTHLYDRDGARPRDTVAYVSPVGVGGEVSWQDGELALRAKLDVMGTLGGVNAYGLRDYLATRTADGLLTTTREQGYYHGLGVSLAPAVEVTWGPVDASASMRVDTFRPLTGLDSNEQGVDDGIRFADQRTRLRSSLGLHIPGLPVRASVTAQRMVRHGDVGDVHATRSETSAWGSLGVIF
jgi:hypothetical protein